MCNIVADRRFLLREGERNGFTLVAPLSEGKRRITLCKDPDPQTMTEQSGNQSVPADSEHGPPWSAQLFALLADSRRRYLLYHLHEQGSCRLAQLAGIIANQETGTVGAVSPDIVRDVYLDLYHTHLPKLDSAGIVDYSESLGEVLLVRTDDAFTRCLDAAVGLEEA